MVFFFSATGNSEWIARTASSRLGLSCVRITEATGTDYDVSGCQYILFVFPVHSWGPALTFLSFVDKLNLMNYAGQPIYAICSCGDDCGRTDRIVSEHLKYPLKATFSVTMPNTYLLLPGFDVDPGQVQEEKLEQAKGRLERILDAIKSGEEKPGLYHAGRFARLKSCWVYPLFKQYVKGKTSFHATSACSECGLCTKVCPTQNITIRKGEEPRWGEHCVQCLACIHRCPVRAIEYGKITQKKGRYKNPFV